MEPTYFAQYRGFEFHCSPERIAGKAYAPRLVIYDASESVTMEIPLGIQTPLLADPTEAAHLAFAHGRRWVDGGYTVANLTTSSGPALLAHEPPMPVD